MRNELVGSGSNCGKSGQAIATNVDPIEPFAIFSNLNASVLKVGSSPCGSHSELSGWRAESEVTEGFSGAVSVGISDFELSGSRA